MSIKKGHEVTVEITDAAYKGKGVGKIDGRAVFVSGTTPGDVVKGVIIKKKKNYLEARKLELIEESPHRIKPKCQHANVCGGCSWQHIPYEKQLEFKTKQVRDHIERIGKLDGSLVKPALGADNPFYYRNKMEYSIGHKRWLTREEINRDEYVSDEGFAAGLHAPGRFDKILNIQECHLQVPESYEILDFVRNYCMENDIPPFNPFEHEGYLRHVMIRNAHHTDDFMVNLVTYRDENDTIEGIKEALLEEFPFITTIVNNINDTRSPTSEGRIERILHGPGYIVDMIGQYRFKIHPNAFFQTNTSQAERLYEVAANFAELEEGDVVYDLYCGVGTLSLFMSDKATNVLGIELSEVSVKNARFNAEENEVDNVHFIQGDMKDVFTIDITDQYGKPDVLITDPPRAGMHPDVVARLLELKVPRIVYVSCNSSTLARDLNTLSDLYIIEEIQPVDMFPQTYHIEAVAKLRLV